MSQFLEEVIKRHLRYYYNDALEIIESLDNQEITEEVSEMLLIKLDEEYAKKIAKEYSK